MSALSYVSTHSIIKSAAEQHEKAVEMRLGTNDQKTSQMRALYVRYCAKKNLGTHIVPNLNHPNKMFMIGHVGVG